MLLATLIGLCTIGAFVTLLYIGRRGAISEKNIHEGIRYLAQYYGPLLGIVVGFYFADRGSGDKLRTEHVLPEIYVFGVVILALWAALPILCLAIAGTYESCIRTLEDLKLYGSGPATAAIAFFFAKTRP